MKNCFSKFWKLTLSSLLALTGFTSCDSEEEGGGGILLMYGPAQMSYQFKGEVTDTEGEPIDKARVILKSIYDMDDKEVVARADTAYTDKEGAYEIDVRNFDASSYKVVCEDPAGGYEADSVKIAQSELRGKPVDFTLRARSPISVESRDADFVGNLGL